MLQLGLLTTKQRNKSHENNKKNYIFFKILLIASDSHKKQMDAIEAAEAEKAIKKEKVEKEYNDAVKAISRVHEIRNKKLGNKKKKEIKKIIEKDYNDKDKISKEISNLFGLTYVPKKDNNNS